MTGGLKEILLQASQAIADKVVSYRRHLHQNPELSFKEFETSAFIKSKFNDLGIGWQAMANTGIAAVIQGELPGDHCIALRADIDALPIHELNDVSYKSKNEGVMHACGHDAHTASLLGTAEILQHNRKHFGGTIKLIFQPAEEVLPGGAQWMIREGVLENPAPKCVIGFHVVPALSAGKISIRAGQSMASMDELSVTIQGKGGHGAMPHLVTDPVMIAAQILVSLQQLISRFAPPMLPAVLSFGKVVANGAINIIPDEVYMEGTFRTLDEGWRNEAHQRMKLMAENIATGLGGNCKFDIRKGYPFLMNDENISEKVKIFSEEFLGGENVEEATVWMASEDFAYYSQQLPSCFFFLGTGNIEKNITAGHHNPHFDVDEIALSFSPGLMAYIAIRMLGED